MNASWSMEGWDIWRINGSFEPGRSKEAKENKLYFIYLFILNVLVWDSLPYLAENTGGQAHQVPANF